ncbi:hypothetical protein [Sporosalibacterium faouarense]|uniref:hypothetical protein n=1 Tax=Sporosalibacterium faouarense TaxID=516123 RepID=UPI00141CD3F0|nr:hypothetical protein [Sporosalibacterium faouarense]MTI47801.1 hypothetical protein [Bacillota bacterium]
MATEPIKLWELYDGLKNKFLYNNDINSIYILLALYDLEENISNIYPQYICRKSIKRRIKYILSNKENKEDFAQNISCLIHEDINRIELCFYLEGYKSGYNDSRWVNILEKKAIEILGIEGIYKNNALFHFISGNSEIKELRKKLRDEIENKERKNRYIETLVYTFANKIIKKKLENIDEYIDKQLKMDIYSESFNINEVSYKMEEEELDKVYHSIVKLLIKNLKNIYKESCWMAINDRVIKRYV